MNTYNILVVDNSPEHIKTAGIILKEIGYDVRASRTKEGSIKLIKNQLPSLILISAQLDNYDGFKLCRFLKESQIYKNIPIIFTTSSFDESIIEEIFSSNAEDYVLKPYIQSELSIKINRCIRHISESTSYIPKDYSDKKDSFLHKLSHDLKSPILIIKDLCSLLQSDLKHTLNNDENKIFQLIYSKCNENISLIENIIKFFNIDKSSCRFSHVNLNTILETNIETLLQKYNNQEISFNVPSLLPSITGDAQMLNTVFLNALDNAIKFSKFKKTSYINILSKEDDKHYVIYIKDNGTGFDTKYSYKLFNLFEKLHNKDEFQGAGIGLAMIAKIMKFHKGTASLSCKESEGACLKLTFPKY